MGAALTRIFSSRKAVLSIIGIVCAMILVRLGSISGKDALDFIKWLLTGWLTAQTAEDVTMHLKGTHPETLRMQAQLAAAQHGFPPPDAMPKDLETRKSTPPGDSEPPSAP